MTDHTQIKKPKEKPEKKKKERNPDKKPFFFTLSLKDKIFLAKHLSVMLKAGIPVQQALNALQDQAETPSLKYILSACQKDIGDGQVLAYSLEKSPRIFNPFFTNVVRVGEASGTLAESLTYLATQLEKAHEIKSKVRSALIYPAIVFFGALSVGGYLAFFILPKLLPLFNSLKTELPFTTKILLWVTNAVSAYWPFLLLGIGVLIVVFIIAWRFRAFRMALHRFSLVLPITAKTIRQIECTQFALILGTLMNAGVKIVPALKITADSLGHLVFSVELHKIADMVERGETIGEQLKKRPKLFSRTTSSMVEVGEQTGRLSESLLVLAEFSEKEVDNTMKNLSSLIEPLVLIVVGVLVGFVAFSIISPIYQLTESVGI